MSAVVDISTAVAALLTTGKAAGWFDGFPAIGVIERQWWPNWEPADVQTLRIGVAPRGQDRERLARMVDTVEPVVLIGIAAHIPATADINDPATVDPYANLAVRIAEIIASGILPAPAVDAKLISVAHVIVDPEQMARRVFFSLITTTWRVAEAARIGLPPAPTVAPALTGTPEVDQTLTCSTGTWLYAPTSYAYSWHVDGVADPALGTASTLVLTGGMAGSAITCVVTATNAAGSGVSAPSNEMTVASSGPPNLTAPVVSWYDEPISVITTKGTWDDPDVPGNLNFSYQWLRDGEVIEGETASIYTIAPADAGAALVARVTATYREGHPDAGLSTTVASEPFNVPA